MLNPDKYVREGYIADLEPLLGGVPIWDGGIPVDEPTPDVYVLITTQTKRPTERTKDGFEWMGTITLDIVSIRPPGTHNTAIVDDIEEILIERIEQEIDIPGFINNNTLFVDSVSLKDENASQSVDRKILIYEHWLNWVD